MTIQIPDDLAHGFEGIAAAQHKSVEQVAVESLRSLVNRTGSPEVLLRALRELPHLSAADVDDIEAATAAGRLPVHNEGFSTKRRRRLRATVVLASDCIVNSLTTR
jgi:predicted transcriptional regulator